MGVVVVGRGSPWPSSSGGGAALLPFAGYRHWGGLRPILFTGRLLAGDTGAPLAGARVFALRHSDLEGRGDFEDEWGFFEAVEAENAEVERQGVEVTLSMRVHVHDRIGARTGPDGSVAIDVGLLASGGRCLFWSSTDVERPEDAVAAHWLAPDGGEPVVVPVGAGEWRGNRRWRSGEYWGTYDLGTIAVPLSVRAVR